MRFRNVLSVFRNVFFKKPQEFARLNIAGSLLSIVLIVMLCKMMLRQGQYHKYQHPCDSVTFKILYVQPKYAEIYPPTYRLDLLYLSAQVCRFFILPKKRVARVTAPAVSQTSFCYIMKRRKLQ